MCASTRDVLFAVLAVVGIGIGGMLVLHHNGRARIGPFRNYWSPASYEGPGRAWYFAWLAYAFILPPTIIAVLPRLEGVICL